ncbi:MAG: hypothetical protein HQK65_04615 [Desulfamplus sp.]|nr:hypothetical protein [Desulfamplus sp.]
MEKWHFYCDESGEFENIGQYVNYKNSILAAMLVPENQRKTLEKAYTALCHKYKIINHAVHGKDVYKEDWYLSFSEELVDLTVNSPLRICRSTFKDDLYGESSGHISEVFACNRYLYMMESLLEHVIFLDPRSFNNALTFSVLPNSRVFPCSKKETGSLQKNGFEIKHFSTGNSQKRSDTYFVSVWNNTGLRIFLNRLQTDYAPFMSLQGQRNIDRIELPVAQNSKDPFVHWIDNLAGILMWTSGESRAKLEQFLYMDIVYGENTDLFKRLCHFYLSGQYDLFVEQYFYIVNKINNRYYSESLKILIHNSLEKFGDCSLKQAQYLESLVDQHLRSSSGEWQYVSLIVDYLIQVLKKKESGGDTLLLRLYNHKLSFHNHRGEVMNAREVIKEYDAMNFHPATIQDWREYVEFMNRKAVSLANLFDFKSIIPEFESNLDALQQSRETLNRLSNLSLNDPLMGKLSGTLAQNYAFIAPFDASSFQKAEKIFLQARSEFDRSADILRQNIYLAHLYMDCGEEKKLKQIIQDIFSNPSVKAFIDSPGSHNSRYMSFAFAVLLKYFLKQQIQAEDILQTFTIKNIRAWFGNAVDEHPFELIYAYLGRLAWQTGDEKAAQEFFNCTLHIPAYGKTADQITIRMIHAQIMVWWALEYIKTENMEKATEKLNLAISIMTKTGENSAYASIISIEDGKGVSGWFADGYNALARSLTDNSQNDQVNSIDIEACREFLKCFTFNYC